MVVPTPTPGSGGRLARAWSGWPGSVARGLFALLPLYWLYRNVRGAEVWQHAVNVGAPTLALAWIVALFAPLTASLRWRLLQRAYGATNPAGVLTLFRHYVVGLYYNVLPSGLAGDLVRGFRVRHDLPTPAASYTVVILERACGLAAILIIAALAMTVGRHPNAGGAVMALNVGIVLAAAVVLVLLVLPYLMERSAAIHRLLRRIPLAGKVLRRIPATRSLPALAVAVGYSLVIQSLPVVVAYILLRRLNPEVTLLACAGTVPLVQVLTAIPLTPLAVGQRELLFVLFFGWYGVPSAQAVTVSLIIFGILLSNAALGGAVHLWERLAGVPAASPPREELEPPPQV